MKSEKCELHGGVIARRLPTFHFTLLIFHFALVSGSCATTAWPETDQALAERKSRQLHNFAAFHCRLVRADADARPVGAQHGVRPRVAILGERLKEFIRQVRM